MGFSLIAEGTLHAGLPDAPWRPLVAKLGYSVGFVLVILGRQQLFTETTLTAVLPVLTRLDRRALREVARVWAVVLGANLVGALGIAWSLQAGGLFDDAARAAFAEVAREAVRPSPASQLVRAVFGAWLIASIVWLMPAARSARFAVIVSITWLVGAGGFAHAIAGSVEALYLVTGGELSVGGFLGRFLVPVVVGNSIGGVALVAALNHAQVVAGHRTGA
jgi:formate/nitrite transporter FocA (FNT family)